MTILRRPAGQPEPAASPPVEFAVVPDPAPRGGYVTAVLACTELDDDTLFPFLGHVTGPDGRTVLAWVHRDADADGSVARGCVALTRGLRRRLGIATADARITLRLPRRVRLRAHVPPARDLPMPGFAHVSPATYRGFARRGRRTRAVLTTEQGLCLPVRLRRRPIEDDRILIPMSLRTLAGIAARSPVQLSSPPRASWAEHRRRALQRVSSRVPERPAARAGAVFLGWVILATRMLDYLAELVFRLAFRSQVLTFRVVQAHPGDDDLGDTIRLHPAAFTALAIAPGGQVLLDWGGHRTAVRALEDHNPFGSEPSSYVLGMVGVRYDPSPPDDFPPHLVARIPAPVRRRLAIPPNTVIAVRRRLRPALVGQLNQLSIPLAGLVLAAVALPAVRGWPLVLGAAVAAALGLAPLRMPRPPRGPWP
ncbi:MAG TPA: hypothetical protein VES42_12175 [Pilimelia sp.]|nr:hypothetical protein [Pilimelia sp.]